MVENFIFVVVFAMFLYFCYMVVRRLRAQPQAPQLAEAQIKAEILSKLESVAKLDLFLKDSRYFEPIAKVQDKNVYKYIYNKGYLYEFKDFLPRENDKKVFLMNEEALSFDYMYYTRITPSKEFVEKHLASIPEAVA